VGCSGWNYPHWRETIYPKGLPSHRWLEHYATLFDTVEINYTFYLHLLPPAAALGGGKLGGADPARLPVHRQGEPLPDAQ
jgi:hypothetical protein